MMFVYVFLGGKDRVGEEWWGCEGCEACTSGNMHYVHRWIAT